MGNTKTCPLSLGQFDGKGHARTATGPRRRRRCYGYQTWILPTERRMFMLWGIRGQRIFVDPGEKLVMVNTVVTSCPSIFPHSWRAARCGWGSCASSDRGT
jgi:hypothetical protein